MSVYTIDSIWHHGSALSQRIWVSTPCTPFDMVVSTPFDTMVVKFPRGYEFFKPWHLFDSMVGQSNWAYDCLYHYTIKLVLYCMIEILLRPVINYHALIVSWFSLLIALASFCFVNLCVMLITCLQLLKRLEVSCHIQALNLQPVVTLWYHPREKGNMWLMDC